MNDNLNKWMFYMKDITSPEIFIKWGFISLICSTLQRRVFTGEERSPLYPNMYVILTGPPACGKGRVITEINKILRYHKQDIKSHLMLKQDDFDPKRGEIPLLIPVGADATTVEALIKSLGRSIRHVTYKKDENTKGMYFHSSMCFCLEEISSMFRKHTEDLVNFLLVAYDCGDYRYETINRGADTIKNCCLNLLAGTTPSFIRRVFGDELLTDGFASRAVFITADKPRGYRLRPPEFSPEQIAGHKDILEHVKKLANLFGQVRFTKEAEEFMEYWWKTDAQTKRANNSPKLIPYYGRKNITVQKLAMALHFGDSLAMEIGIEYCREAIGWLEEAEKMMDKALSVEGKNKLSSPSDSIIKILADDGPQNKNEILFKAWEFLPEGKDSLDKILEYLLAIKRIKLTENGSVITLNNEIGH